MDLLPVLSRLPTAAVYPILLGLTITSILIIVRLVTTLQYHNSVRHFLNEANKDWGGQPREPPQIPYTIPWLGHTMDFMDRKVGRLWKDLFARHPRETGACSLIVGGKRMYVIFNATTVQAMFRDKKLSRHETDEKLYQNGLGMSAQQAHQASVSRHFEHDVNLKYIVRSSCVNELTAGFIHYFDRELAKPLPSSTSPEGKDPLKSTKQEEIANVAAWVRPRMFTASTTALFGTELLDEYPEYVQDFFALDAQFVALFFGLPDFLVREALALRDRVFSRLTQWNVRMYGRKSNGTDEDADGTKSNVVDPDDGPDWEPRFGARYNRARQLAYRQRRLNDRSIAGFDYGATFALNSNALPATTWMLLHILDPRADGTLYPRVMEELRSAVRSSPSSLGGSSDDDGGKHSGGIGSSLDIPALISLPLLQSIWTETLRLYADVFVFRNVEEDMTLPLDESGKRSVLFKEGSDLIAPTWIPREDPSLWGSADSKLGGTASSDVKSPGEFDSDRFLVSDENDTDEKTTTSTKKKTFSLPASVSGKYFPFGGGRTICPGRVFAKQEALAAVAMVLLTFEFEVVGFVDEKGDPTETFPSIASLFPGNAVVTAAGDLRVKIKRRQW